MVEALNCRAASPQTSGSFTDRAAISFNAHRLQSADGRLLMDLQDVHFKVTLGMPDSDERQAASQV